MRTRAIFVLGLLTVAGCGDLAVIPNTTAATTASGAGNNGGGSATPDTGNPNGTAPAADPNAVANPNAVVAPAPSDPNAAVPSAGRTDWLTIKGNQFMRNGKVWIGRGVTMHDTRSCDFCTSKSPDVAEMKRRIDDAVTNWHVNFIRLLLEMYPSAAYTDGGGGMRVQWDTFVNDPNYLHDIEEIVQYIGSKPGVYVMLSLWKDPGFTVASSTVQGGLPTAESAKLAATLASTFQKDAQVMIAVANEPESNFDDSQDASCLAAMDSSVAAVRKVEDAANAKHHIVAVQGTAQWGRTITYYVNHPVNVDNGDNVAYETHPYTAQSNFQASLLTPAQTIPVIIGEFAPANPYMTQADATALMSAADTANIPWTAWDYHMHCNSYGTENMLLNVTDNNQCVPNVPLTPSAWGLVVKNHIVGVQ